VQFLAAMLPLLPDAPGQSDRGVTYYIPRTSIDRFHGMWHTVRYGGNLRNIDHPRRGASKTRRGRSISTIFRVKNTWRR